MATFTNSLSAPLGTSYADLTASVGYTVKLADGSTAIARTNSGVTQLAAGSGSYVASVNGWNDAWTGLYWFDVTGRSGIGVDTFVGILSSYDPYIRTMAVNLGAAKTGLTGSVGYTVYAADGVTVLIALTTSGVTELVAGTGVYFANIPGWHPSWVGTIVWTITGQPSIVPAESFEAAEVVIVDPIYTDIYSWIRSRLQVTEAQVPNSTFNPDIEIAFLEYLGPYDVAYSDLSGTDLALVDKAIGLVVAARLQIPLSTGGGNSGIQSIEVKAPAESMSIDYAPIGDSGGEVKKWLAEAMQLLALTSFGKLRSGARFGRFVATGRRRQLCEQSYDPCCD